MPLSRRTLSLPMPAADLARLRDSLDMQYGYTQWEERDGNGAKLLVIRVPRDEPDIVNDLEGALEVLSPSDLEPPTAVLVGSVRTHLLPIQVLRDLMEARLRFDRTQCARLRNLKPLEPHLYQANEDPRRLPRLAVRVARPNVAAIDDSDIAALTAVLGPRATQLAHVRIVYLIADKDELRVDGGLFLQDVLARWSEEQERHALAAQLAQRERKAAPAPRPAPPPARAEPAPRPSATPLADAVRSNLLPPEAPVRGERTVVAPLRSLHDDVRAAVDALPEPGGRPSLRSTLGAMRTRVAGATVASDDLEPPALRQAASGMRGAPVAESRSAIDPPDPTVAALAQRLEELGYAVLLQPPSRVPVTLAAERPAFPSRVIARVLPSMDRAAADALLLAAKELQADVALLVSAESDLDARRRFIATRCKWLGPSDVAALTL